ncbi:hypothetical protein Tsubulata_044684 [Turnera subulata]|uniref:Uncharacterized protein n=1 Tax=Turnera subulata TaxID=218843 RepID=A0A9Q0JLW5_9ROSI|nr:hypothetical protein Tsubulata_044684 [Turnera subulata]
MTDLEYDEYDEKWSVIEHHSILWHFSIHLCERVLKKYQILAGWSRSTGSPFNDIVTGSQMSADKNALKLICCLESELQILVNEFAGNKLPDDYISKNYETKQSHDQLVIHRDLPLTISSLTRIICPNLQSFDYVSLFLMMDL